MQDKVELLFDHLQDTLDEADFGSWRASQVKTFLSLLNGYYEHQNQLHNQEQQRAKRHQCASHDECEMKDNTALMSAMDRSLTKLRRILQQRIPYGTIHEPNSSPSNSAATSTSTAQLARKATPQASQEHLHGQQPVKEDADVGQVCKLTPIFPVDAFLYLEEDVEALVERGCISREYCRSCGSTEIGLTDFITHSFSQEQLVYLTCFLLPALGEGALGLKVNRLYPRDTQTVVNETNGPFSVRQVVDVGSRLGVVLMAAHFAAEEGSMTATKRVTGVEMDGDLVKLQRDLITRFAARPSSLLELDVIESNCFEEPGAGALRNADVIILHNVFEYFTNTSAEHLHSWKRLREFVSRRGQLLICSPSLWETFALFSEDDVKCVFPQSENSTKDSHNGNGSRKRSREESDEELDPHVPRALRRWLDDWVGEVDVELVRDHFMSLRSGSCQGHKHKHEEGSNSASSQCDEEEAEDEELLERLQSVRVYVVR